MDSLVEQQGLPRVDSFASRYRLFEDPLRRAANMAIDRLLTRWASEYDVVRRQYPGLGMGDTATDEVVVRRFYGLLHFGTWDWPEVMAHGVTSGGEQAPTPSTM